ncbi:plasmacytoid dendritic cell antigen processing and presentation [Mactra antiquata]
MNFAFSTTVSTLECYQCPNHNTEKDCNSTTVCQDHQVCMLRRTLDSNNAVHYHSACEDKHVCQTYVHTVHSALHTAVGKKRDISHVETANGECVISCCGTDLCNDGCHPPPKESCHGHNVEEFQNECYVFVNHEMSFHAAREYCKKYNYHLVEIESDMENNFVINKLKQLNRGPVQYWLGITDKTVENNWTYVGDGGRVTYFDWSPGEPDGNQGADGSNDADCAVFDPFLDFHWRDEGCSLYQVSQPICESN